ncbi:phosphoesterase family protein [Rhodopirellula maiorica SM1]|uniref:Phosphoesterase family protein n=1 Tax=Rhodopirellula maiorica SM1 TaxID=1265738 RepID=M5RRH8_9BACT|nr:LamG-like jellyroll fold domain-containing protein [Rhodopirellula maiorica]EMI21890.1 phosphoesterase family protein [Rhodopirellula maiorica SM1]
MIDMTLGRSLRSILVTGCLVLALCSASSANAQQNQAHHWDFSPALLQGTTLSARQGESRLTLPNSDSIDKDAPFGWIKNASSFIEIDKPNQSAVLPKSAFSVAAWVRVDKFSDWTGIISAIEDNGGEEYGWMLGLQGRSFTFALASTASDDGNGLLTYCKAPLFSIAGRWSLVSATFDGDTMRLFVDGKMVNQSSQQKGDVLYPDQGVRLAIGAYVDRDETHPLNGRVGECWITDEVWSPDAIQTLYAAGRDRYPDAPLIDHDPLDGFTIRSFETRPKRDTNSDRLPNAQLIAPAGDTFMYPARPVDAAISDNNDVIAVKDNVAVVFFDAKTWKVIDRLPFPDGGASMHGIAFAADGKTLWATNAQRSLFEAIKKADRWMWSRVIALPGSDGGHSHPCGIAHDADRDRLYVCLSRNNTVAEVDLDTGQLLREIPVGVAPYDVVLLPDQQALIVSNWGGRHPRDDEKSAPSSGTEVLVDDRGVAKSGTVGRVDLTSAVQVREVHTGLHPADLELAADGETIYVANANSDTVSMIRTSDMSILQSIVVRPDPNLPYGSATNALALSDDEQTLYAANGGNNAVGVLKRDDSDAAWNLAGFIPTAWYPAALVFANDSIYVANTKGIGSRNNTDPNKFSVKQFLGAVSKVAVPTETELARYSEEAHRLIQVPRMLRQQIRASKTKDVAPVAVPKQIGHPSLIKHVVYVIKENRTYDQVLGDLPQGDGEPKLCDYPRAITPNHHRLAEQFVLLDNFYCNGVNSSDGHSWATEGNVTDHLEKSFGGFTRSYSFGDDPLNYSSTGFIWDNVLLHGLSFRNYGEMDYAGTIPADASFSQIYDDFKSGTHKIGFTKSIGIETLARYSCPTYPGWNMRIPDVLRAKAFIDELQVAQQKGEWYDFMIVYLPQDHTSGMSSGMPHPQAHMADNDLALGQVVEAISKSRFWKETAVFVVEDDPQAGYDHIDGHRSVCLVSSPYIRRGAVVSSFYNQTSVLHTMQRILGLPPMNQMDATAPIMFDCFQDTPDLTPYESVVPETPLNKIVVGPEAYPENMKKWFVATANEDFEGFDRADEDTLNRILWHAARGDDVPYPAEWAGAHGRGLKQRGLIISEEDDDD